MTAQRIHRCLEHNLSVMVGSADAAGQPATCRALALVSADDLATATVFLPVSTSAQTIANVTATKQLAVVATHPLDHASLQLKGQLIDVRPARADEEAAARRGFDGFAELLKVIGVPPRVTNAVVRWPAYAIDMLVSEIYDQTPGPQAGARVK